MTDSPVFTIVIGNDFERKELDEYVAALPAAYTPFADQFTMLNPSVGVEAIEGEAPKLLLVGRWASRSAFDAYYNSPAYQAAKAKREGIGRFTILVVPDLSA